MLTTIADGHDDDDDDDEAASPYARRHIMFPTPVLWVERGMRREQVGPRGNMLRHGPGNGGAWYYISLMCWLGSTFEEKI